ncbi:MAG: hypothetical protein JXJ22_06455 [Bacteroidales bacterium]|nr:hypothetical protein [Bacteroidales bacterium]
MRKRIISIFIILVCFGTYALAKERDTINIKKYNLLLLSTGYSNQIIKDEAISPFIYKGQAMPVELCYNSIGIKNIHTLSIQFGKITLKSKIPDYANYKLVHYVNSTTVDFKYSFKRKLHGLSIFNTDFFMGGEFNSFFNYRDHFFTEMNNEFMFDFFNSLSFDAYLKKKFRSENNILSVSINLPLISYVLMRQTYNAVVSDNYEGIDLNKNLAAQIFKKGDFVSISKLFSITAGLTYTGNLGNHFGYQFKYNLHYYKFTQYDNLFYSRNLYTQILGGIFIKF